MEKQGKLFKLNNERWTQAKTAKKLGISQASVSRAIKIATAVEERPELSGLKGSQILEILRREKREKAIAKTAAASGVSQASMIKAIEIVQRDASGSFIGSETEE